MSTNYYATVRIPTIQDETAEFRFHIGKTGAGISVSGTVFPSFQSITDFLRMHEQHAIIQNEYGTVLILAELIDLFMDSTPMDRRRQYDWVETEIETNARGQAAYLRGVGPYRLDSLGFTVSPVPFF